MDKISRYISGTALTVLVVIALLITLNIAEPASASSAPTISANVNSTQIYLNQSVTLTGQLYPVNPNDTIQVTLVRPNLSWIDLYTPVNSTTGTFNVSFTLDAYGIWTIYAIHDAAYERVSVEVISPPTTPSTSPSLSNAALEPSLLIIGVVLAMIIGGALAVGKIVRDKKRKVTSARVFVQIGSLFFIFLGVFLSDIGLAGVATPSGQNYLIGTNLAGAQFPDGLSVPTFGCYYASGRTVTCALWQIQAYIFPYWNSGHGWGVNYVLPGIERLAIVIGLVMLMSLILGRVFCGWVCPFGLYLDFVSWIRKSLKLGHKNLSEKSNEKIKQLRYVIIAVILLVSFILGSTAIAGTSLLPGTQMLIWPKSFVTPGGYDYTYFYTPFCAVCPMRPL